ncbi:putative uncharacterized protein C8orf44 [Plecturocebus cupreus]
MSTLISVTPAKPSEIMMSSFQIKMESPGQVQRLTPVIPALQEAEAGRSFEVRSLRPAWLTWDLFLLKSCLLAKKGETNTQLLVTYQAPSFAFIVSSFPLWAWHNLSTTRRKLITNVNEGRVQWLTPAIPAVWEAENFGRLRRTDHEVRSLRPAWSTWQKLISTKNTKISQAWWFVPVISATQEAEAGELLEPGRQRLQLAPGVNAETVLEGLFYAPILGEVS